MKKALSFIVITGRWIGGLTIMSMMFLTFSDVLGRYVFNKSIIGTAEITDLMMIIIVFFVLPYSTAMGENLTIVLITSRLSVHTQKILKIITSLLSVVIIGVMTWQITYSIIPTIKMREATEILQIPWVAFVGLAAIGCIVLTIQLIVIFFDSIKRR